METTDISDNYFDSNQEPGPRRAVENLVESAWYSKKQAGFMTVFCIVIILLVCITSIITLMITSADLQEAVIFPDQVNRVITSWLLLVFSLGLVRYGWAYFKFYQRCQKTESTADHLLKSSDISEADALKQWYEYQLTRSSAPLLPHWLWWLWGSSLNDIWNNSKRRQ